MKRSNAVLRTGIVLVLLVAAAAAVLRSGAGKGAAAARPGKAGAALSWQKDTSPFQFDLYFYGAWGTFYPWKGSYVEKVIEQKTGVHPNIIVPTGDEKEYLSVMVASGKFPDAMVLEWYDDMTKRIIEAGKIYPIKELTDKYAPEFWDQIPQDVKAYHTQGRRQPLLPAFVHVVQGGVPEVAGEADLPARSSSRRGSTKPWASPPWIRPEKFIAMLQDDQAEVPGQEGHHHRAAPGRRTSGALPDASRLRTCWAPTLRRPTATSSTWMGTRSSSPSSPRAWWTASSSSTPWSERV